MLGEPESPVLPFQPGELSGAKAVSGMSVGAQPHGDRLAALADDLLHDVGAALEPAVPADPQRRERQERASGNAGEPTAPSPVAR